MWQSYPSRLLLILYGRQVQARDPGAGPDSNKKGNSQWGEILNIRLPSPDQLSSPPPSDQAAPSCHSLPQVVASFAKGGLPELLLGSVAGYLTHHCPRPVAVLHMGKWAQEAAPPVSPPATTSPTLKVEAAAAAGAAGAAESAAPAGRNLLVPVDGSEESFQSCRWTLDNLYRTGKDE